MLHQLFFNVFLPACTTDFAVKDSFYLSYKKSYALFYSSKLLLWESGILNKLKMLVKISDCKIKLTQYVTL